MAQEDIFIGFDIGGTKVHGLVAQRDGAILAELRQPTQVAGGAALVAQLQEMQEGLCHAVGIQLPTAIGLGLPAAVDPISKRLSVIPNIANMEGEGFYPRLRGAFSCPIAMENDVNCAALAEAWTGGGEDSLAFVAIGTGIGMGIVSGGKLLRGAAGAAGEIAYLPLGGDLSLAEIRQAGALEHHLGGEGWRRGYLRHGGQSDPDLATLFATPDRAFKHVIAEQADLLARALLAVQAVIAPEAVVLGGSIGAQPLLLEALQARLSLYLPQPLSVRASRLAAEAGALGAARAAMELAKLTQM